MSITLEKIPKIFEGRGQESKGDTFKQEVETEFCYVYSCTGIKAVKYEVFMKRETPKLVDFKTQEYSTTEFKESYPKANAFGIWAWCFMGEEAAFNKVKEIEKMCHERIGKGDN